MERMRMSRRGWDEPVDRVSMRFLVNAFPFWLI